MPTATARSSDFEQHGRKNQDATIYMNRFSRRNPQHFFLLTAQEASLVTCQDWSGLSASGR